MADTLVKTEIRPLSPADLESVIAIDTASFGVVRRGYFEKRLSAATRNPKDYVFVGVFEKNQLAGFAFAKLVKGAFGKAGAIAALDAISVHPARGLQGFGHKLLDEVERVLRHKGVSTLTSQANWSHWQILSFLAHAGFEIAPGIVISRSTGDIPQELEPDPKEDALEVDYSAPVSDAPNALSRDRIPIRSMTAADLAKTISIDAARSGRNRTEYFTRMQEENLNQSGVRVSLVAEQDGYQVGFIMARVDFGEFGQTSTEAVLDSIAVDRGFGNQGIGHALMTTLMLNLRGLQVKSVRTEVDWNDTGLIDFFSSVGFRPAQRISLTKSI